MITFFIINYWTRSRVESTLDDELRVNFSTIRVLTNIQMEMLTRSSRVIAESPRLRAVAEVGDPGTGYQLSRELTKNRLSNLFILTDRHGTPLARILDGRSFDIPISGKQSVQQALEYVTTHDVWTVHGKPYRVISLPVLLDAELIGSLTLGFQISMQDLGTLHQATNSDIILTVGGVPFLSTLDSCRTELLRNSLGSFGASSNTLADTVCSVFSVSAEGEAYLAARVRMTSGSNDDSSQVSYVIVKPFSKEVEDSMSPIMGTFGVVSVGFLAFTTIIAIVISKGITKPIRDLVRGTHEISQGNYGYEIPVQGKNELSYLGKQFMEMSQSLKEKVAELDQLNTNLSIRNTDLDETLKKLRDAQQELVKNERLAATGKLTAQLAHEINNPIHNIQSCLKTALNRLPNETRGRELITVAFDEASRMSRLIHQMLDIYRSSFVEMQLNPINVNDILNEVIAVVREDLASSNIEVRTELVQKPPVVFGSQDKLKQVFMNIITNARDAMPSGGFLTIVSNVEGCNLTIAVTDTGIGIPQEHLDRIFEAFFTTKEKVSGVGLGLSVSNGIVTQHRGTITVRSMQGEGSTFIVSLPYINERTA